MQNNSEIAGPLKEWTGEFGNNYINRNELTNWKLKHGVKAFGRILKNRKPKSILEIGSNIGLNQFFLSNMLKKETKLYAVEPNKKAYDILISNTNFTLTNSWNCSAFNLPISNSSIDLVFTSGVLIHITPKDLERATDEIVRVAQNYVLCIEYFSHNPEEVPYHNQDGLLFKRDFGSFYMDRYSTLKCIDYGFLWQHEFKIFDNLNWWLFKKSN